MRHTISQMHSLIRLGIGTTALLTSTVQAQSIQNLAGSQTNRLGKIVVTSQPDSRTVGFGYSMSRDSLEFTSAHSLDEVLQWQPSINVRNGDDGTPRIDVRGFGSRQVRLLINGMPFHSADDDLFDPSLIPTLGLGQITYQPGGSSVLYGEGGMGAVIDVRTRGSFTGSILGAQLELGNEGFKNLSAFTGFGSETTEFFLAAGQRKRNGFTVSDDFKTSLTQDQDNYQSNGLRNNSDTERGNLLTTFNYQLTQRFNFGLLYNLSQGENGKPPSVFDCTGNATECLGDDAGDPYANPTRYERLDDVKGQTLQLGGDYAFNDDVMARLWYYENTLDSTTTRYSNNDYDTFDQRNNYRVDERSDVSGMHLQFDGVDSLVVGTIGVSLDMRNEKFSSTGKNCEMPTSGTADNRCVESGGLDPSEGATGGENGTDNTSTVNYNFTKIDVDREIDFLSAAIEFSQALGASGGEIVYGAAYHRLDKGDAGDDTAPSWRLLYNIPLNSAIDFFASIAQKVDGPSSKQLYDATFGNAELGFQRARHIETGMKFRLLTGTIELSYYNSDVTDFIDLDTTTEIYMNRQKLRLQGVDITSRFALTENLQWDFAYSYLNAADKSSNAPTDVLPYRPENKMLLGLRWQMKPLLQLSALVQRVGKQAYFNRDNDSQYRYLDSYTLTSMRLEYHFSQLNGKLFASVDNLGDINYETNYGFPQAGRSVYYGIQLSW